MRSWRKRWHAYLRSNRQNELVSRGLNWKQTSQLREAITSQARDLAPAGILFQSIRNLLHDQFYCNSILNISRSCNSSAHEIAKIALNWDPGQSVI